MRISLLLVILAIGMSSCRKCSKSGQRHPSSPASVVIEKPITDSQGENNIVKMRKSGGVYYVPVTVNGITIEFIFDTGASNISISTAEAIFLFKQNKLSADDIIGEESFIIADGSIHEGMIINLKQVKIGNKTLKDVRASVVDNLEAPLLLGQSALERFGKISIDFTRNEIKFE